MIIWMYLAYILLVAGLIGSILATVINRGVPQKPLTEVTPIDSLKKSDDASNSN